ncbi:hypothetical protein CUMW_107700 [Citrus unshiu]|uniref:Uncharacterized protein n=1 Tax=Citrus unshiu TaxID=55188 RepID=A0A2H5P6A5_CITUN|nr:hypothetical protein CUMW_107700 [Citrus unshiu]
MPADDNKSSCIHLYLEYTSELRKQRWSLKGMAALVTELNQRIKEWNSKGLKVSGSVCDQKIGAQREKLVETVSSVCDGKRNIHPTTEYTMEDFSTIMTTNFESAYHLSQFAYTLLKASGKWKHYICLLCRKCYSCTAKPHSLS